MYHLIVDVSLMLRGVTIPNDSFVDLDDVLNAGGGTSEIPSNTNPRNGTLLCVTDLKDCCAAPKAVRGDWYFPDGSRVGFGGTNSAFQANRGANEEKNGQTIIYGSVRLWRRYSGAPGRGHFYCELPSDANPRVNQTLYANICEIIFI